MMQTINDLNPVLNRLFLFIQSKGGFSSVGRKIGKASQMFHNLAKRNAKPSVETLEAIAEAYPDIDFNFILKGEETVSKTELVAVKEKMTTYEELVKRALSPKFKGVSVSPKLYDVFGDFSALLHRNNAAVCLPIYAN